MQPLPSEIKTPPFRIRWNCDTPHENDSCGSLWYPVKPAFEESLPSLSRWILQSANTERLTKRQQCAESCSNGTLAAVKSKPSFRVGVFQKFLNFSHFQAGTHTLCISSHERFPNFHFFSLSWHIYSYVNSFFKSLFVVAFCFVV